MRKIASGKSGRSLHNWFLYSVLLVVGFSSAPASATVITLDLTADIFAGSVTSIVDAGGFAGESWFSAPLSFSPVTIDQGDQLNLTVEFSPGQSMELASGSFFSGNENIGFRESPIPGISLLVGASTVVSFSGLAGDLDAVLPVTSNFSTSGQLAGSILKDLTDTAFSFEGFTFDTTYTTLNGGPVTIVSLGLYAAAEDITLLNVAIPEPTSLALMGLGLAGMGFSRHRKAKMLTTV